MSNPDLSDEEIEAIYAEERRLMHEVYPYPGDEKAEEEE